MKPFILILLSACLATGHVVPGNRRPLASRQKFSSFSNPDNEPEYELPLPGKKAQKSRIASGVGPAYADQRFFDWDESCADPGERAKILAAYENAIELAKWTSKHLQNLQDRLPEPIGAPGKDKKNNIQFIKDKDPAYQQMFRSLDSRIPWVKETFDLFVDLAGKSPADRNGNKPGALRFICDSKGQVKTGDEKKSYCGQGATAAQAISTSPHDPKRYAPTIEPKYSFETSSSIIFCPAFFEARFPTINTIVSSGEHTLDKIDCAERILMHEYMHLPWVRNMGDKPDEIGYYKCAEYAKKAGWGNIKSNPDNFTWLALYAYFNNNPQACGRDVWPPGEKKFD